AVAVHVGNGSTDPVWLSREGEATYLELFPVRPNQLSRIENGIGMVTEVTYGTSVQHMARDGGWEAWEHRLPHPMIVVDSIDTYDLLTNIHEVNTFMYHDGFYDGIEKQFRGYARVEQNFLGDDSTEGGLIETTYDVGATDTYRNGLMLTRASSSAGRPLRQQSSTYEDCTVSQVPEGTSLPVRFICEVASTTIVQEGAEPSDWVTLSSSMEYDGYGNVVRSSGLGVTARGGQGCAPCERDPSEFGTPCGAQCLGDEMFTETEFVEPGANTGDQWILNFPFREVTYGRSDSDQRSETLTYYDGEDFVGMNLGSLTQGKITRVERRVDDTRFITSTRDAYDRHGNVIETIDPVGTLDGHTNRRVYVMDADALRVIQVDLLTEDPEGNPYRLRQEVQYEPVFDKVVESTSWMRVVDGQPLSSRRSTMYAYDQFARLTATARPGDTIDLPTERYRYELGNPTSRIITQTRSQPGRTFDLETIRCIDGKGRDYQTRKRLAANLYQVDGLQLFDNSGSARRLYQPYQSNSAQCDTSAPEGTLYSDFKRDASYRVLEYTLPDGAIYGEASVRRTVYRPLSVVRYDAEDTDPTSDHEGTPVVLHTDGMGRSVALERWLDPLAAPEVTMFHYDGLGRMTGTTDPAGNRKRQTYDLLGRVLEVVDPNTEGNNTYVYDDASKLTAATDGRGITTMAEYDGINRLSAKWDAANREATLISWSYDFAPDCDPTQCSNTEGRMVQTTYPDPTGERATDWMGFDARGRTIHQSRTLAGHTFTFGMEYDNADRLIENTLPNGQVIRRHFDDASRLVSIDGVIDNIAFDERGLVESITRADGTMNMVRYDDLMRESEITTLNTGGDILQGFAYTHDRINNILSIEGLADSGPAYDATYSYDAWYRLTEAQLGVSGTSEPESIAYNFNAIDNLMSRTSTMASSSANKGAYSYDGFGPNAVTEVGGVSMNYDRGGYMTTSGDRTLDWDFLGRMTQITQGEQTLNRNMYGPLQSRVMRWEGDSVTFYPTANFVVRDGISSFYVRRENMRMARLDDASMAPTILSDLAPADGPDNQINAADAWMAFAAEADIVEPQPEASPVGTLLMSSVRRLLLETGPAQVQLHHDHLGSITMATDGEPTGQRSFMPLGQVRESQGYVDPFGFTGQELDRSTGLVHFDYRYYDPQIG
ncbi:MAG: toxin TcdB middle/N-terminal domain-containing protein, partial [Myxococcota bacterium]